MKQKWGDRGCGCEMCEEAFHCAGVGVKCKVFDDFIDTRGFVMRRGHRARVVHRCKDEPVLPGRSSFKRRAGGHRDVYRCSMCKPGRHNGPGGAKSLKHVKGSQLRQRWLDVKDEARQAVHSARTLSDVMPRQLSPSTSSQRKPPSPQKSAAAVHASELPASAPVLPLSISSFQRCQCPDCPQRRRRRSRFTIIPESIGPTENTEAKGYETILADLPQFEEWQLVEGHEWVRM